MSRKRDERFRFVNSKDDYLGNVFQTKSSGSCKVVEYVNSTNVTVEFENGYRKRTSTKELRTGWLQNPTRHLIFGVWVDTDVERVTPLDKELYKRWVFILRRCFYTKHNKHYEDVGICDEWLTFANFRDDLMKTKGVENLLEKDWAIDKDIISLGNKIYCPQYVRPVPREVNGAILTSKVKRSKYGLGVSVCSKGKFYSRCSGNIVYGFSTPKEARESYWNMKKDYIEDMCSKWEGIICQDVIDSLRSVTFEDLN